MVDDDKSIVKKEDPLIYTETHSVLEYTVSLLKNRGTSIADWKAKSIALNLSMLALAEVQAERVSNLSRVVSFLEDKVFAEQTLINQSPQQLVQLYKVASEALQKSTDFVRDSIAGTDWGRLEADLISLQAKKEIESEMPSDTQSIVKVILTELSKVTKKKMEVSVENTSKNNNIIDVQ